MRNSLDPEKEMQPGTIITADPAHIGGRKVLLRSVTSPVANVAPLMPSSPSAEEAMARFADALADIAQEAFP